MRFYSIANWKECFETNETRKLVNLQWWKKPNKHDGLGFRRMAQQPNRIELYCAWNLIGDIASRSSKDQRGKLIRDGRALTSEDLALMTGFPREIFETAFEFFSRPDMGWLVVSPEVPADSPGTLADSPEKPTTTQGSTVSTESPGTPADSPGGREGRERREEIEERGGDAPPPLAQIPSEHEFLDEFMNDGIPAAFLRKQWAWFEGNNGWLDSQGRLKKYAVIVRNRWTQDRAQWNGTKGRRGPNI